MPTRVRCLYTKHVRQKKKTYHDGVVEVDEASRAAVLLDEGGERLAAGRAEAWGEGRADAGRQGRRRAHARTQTSTQRFPHSTNVHTAVSTQP